MAKQSVLIIDAGRLYDRPSPVRSFLSKFASPLTISTMGARAVALLIVALVCTASCIFLSYKPKTNYIASSYAILPTESQLFWTESNGQFTQSPEQAAKLKAIAHNWLINTGAGHHFTSRDIDSSFGIKVTPVDNKGQIAIAVTGPDANSASILVNGALTYALDRDEADHQTLIASIKPGEAPIIGGATTVVKTSVPEEAVANRLMVQSNENQWLIFGIVLVCLTFGGFIIGAPNEVVARLTQRKAKPAPKPREVEQELPKLAAVQLSYDEDQIPNVLDIGVAPELMTQFTEHLNNPERLEGRAFVVTRSSRSGVSSRLAVLELGRHLAKSFVDVLIVDADLSSAYGDRDAFGLPDFPGLYDAVNGDTPLDDCVLEDDEYPGLSALSAGRTGMISLQESSTFLASAEMERFLDKLQMTADVVLIHAPAVLDDEGALALAKSANSVIIATASDDEDLVPTAALLYRNNCELAGTFLLETVRDYNLAGLLEASEAEEMNGISHAQEVAA